MTSSAPDVRFLLARLSEWERRFGTRFASASDVISTGESTAAIEDLKRQLDQAGARYHWQHATRKYVLDSLGPPPGGEGEPEAG
jgi:hypothetical protein